MQVERVRVDAKNTRAPGDVGGREAGELLVKGRHRCAGHGVNDDDAEEGRVMLWELGRC